MFGSGLRLMSLPATAPVDSVSARHRSRRQRSHVHDQGADIFSNNLSSDFLLALLGKTRIGRREAPSEAKKMP